MIRKNRARCMPEFITPATKAPSINSGARQWIELVVMAVKGETNLWLQKIGRIGSTYIT